MIALCTVLLVAAPALASPRGFQVLFQDRSEAVTGNIAITITTTGMPTLTGNLHNDGKPPDQVATDHTWTTSFSDSPDAAFRVELKGTGIDLSTEVAAGLLSTVPRLVLISDGTTLTATNVDATRPPPGSAEPSVATATGSTGASGQVPGQIPGGQPGQIPGGQAGQIPGGQAGQMGQPGQVPTGMGGQYGPPPGGEMGPPPDGQGPGQFGAPPANGTIPGQLGAPPGMAGGRNMAGDAGSPNAHSWYAFLPGVTLWGVLIGSGLFGVGVGLGLSYRRNRRVVNGLRGRYPMRVVSAWAPKADEGRPVLVIGPGEGTRALTSPSLPGEVLARATALGLSTIILVTDESLLDRPSATESGLDALLRTVDGQLEVIVVRPDGRS